MAPNLSQIDERLCRHYARFASYLDRWHFKILYWTLFIVNLVVLFLASWTYIQGQESLEKYSHDVRKRTRSLLKCTFLCLGCISLSTITVVVEAYALLALQFCDGEDLMNLYWATWTMTQVGALIAMMGIILSLCHALRNRRHPPWALALGTPVLVIAGILHLVHDCIRRRVKKRINKSAANSVQGGPSMISQVNTIQVPPGEDAEIQGDFIGFTIDGGPIVRFNSPASSVLNGEVLGYCEGNRPLIAYQKDAIRFITSQDQEQQQQQQTQSQKEEQKQEPEHPPNGQHNGEESPPGA